MTTIKQSSIESKKYFDEHKETTRSESRKIKTKDDLSDKQKNALTKLLLDDVREKQSTDEFKKHTEVRKADYKKIRELVIERVGDPKKVTKEDIHEAVDFFYGKSEKKESKETGKITHEHLLNKPNMTAKDKEGMKKSIDYLVEKKMDTSENLKKLDAIVYTSEYIEVGGIKRARKDITAKPNGKNIFQHNNVTYFKRSESMIKEQNDLLAKQGMEIPLDSTYERSMRALLGEYSKLNRYEGGNILSLITDMSMDGFCNSGGGLDGRGRYGGRWSASPGDDLGARYFGFGGDGGGLGRGNRYGALPVRPVLK